MRMVLPLTEMTGATDTLSSLGHPPKVRSVEPSKAINPTPSLDCNPMKARYSPMAADVDKRTGCGMSFAILVRNPKAAMIKNKIPSISTAASADL